MSWIIIQQDFLGNIGLELLKTEGKYFLAISKYEKQQNVVLPIELGEELARRICKLIEYWDNNGIDDEYGINDDTDETDK